MSAERKISVLEIGSGSVGISHFIKYAGLKKKCDLTLADIDVNALSKVKSEKTVAIYGDSLPFEDDTFDVVISLDTLEHIPKDKRQKFLSEIKKAAKKTTLLHFVAYDPPEQFLSKDADQKYQKWHTKKFHKPDKWTAEHLMIDPPTIQEINDILPGALITGTQNINAWFDYTTFCEQPLVGFFTGFMYITKWKKKDNSPPFHSCFVKWIKSN
jgi:SAM-dependent methyltransferase